MAPLIVSASTKQPVTGKPFIIVTCSERRFRMHWVSGKVSWGPPPAHFRVQHPRSPHTLQQWSHLLLVQARSAYQENPAPANTCSQEPKVNINIQFKGTVISYTVSPRNNGGPMVLHIKGHTWYCNVSISWGITEAAWVNTISCFPALPAEKKIINH